MNHARIALEAGGTVNLLVPKDGLLHSPARQAKKAFKRAGLSGRQIRKLRKELRRDQDGRGDR